MIVINLVTPKARAKHELLFNKPAYLFFCKLIRDRSVEQKLTLSSSFRCDQNQNCDNYEFNNIFLLLKSDLDVQQTHL